jgi:hypothetical protein
MHVFRIQSGAADQISATPLDRSWTVGEEVPYAGLAEVRAHGVRFNDESTRRLTFPGNFSHDPHATGRCERQV